MICGHFVLGVGVVTVRASPVVEGNESLHCVLSRSLIFRLVIALIHDNSTFLFLFSIVANALLKTLVEFIDPSLDTAKMERLVTLLTIPQGAALVDRIMTNDALLFTFSHRFNQKDALFRQIFKLVEEVTEIVLDLSFVFCEAIAASFNKLDLLLASNLMTVSSVHVLGSRAQVFILTFALARIVFSASLVCGTHLLHVFSCGNRNMVIFMDQLISVSIISLPISFLTVKKFTLLLVSSTTSLVALTITSHPLLVILLLVFATSAPTSLVGCLILLILGIYTKR